MDTFTGTVKLKTVYSGCNNQGATLKKFLIVLLIGCTQSNPIHINTQVVTITPHREANPDTTQYWVTYQAKEAGDEQEKQDRGLWMWENQGQRHLAGQVPTPDSTATRTGD